MHLPDWSALAAAIVTFFTGATFVGRLYQRINGHGIAISENKEAWKALDDKMDAHTKQSADQYAQIQRSLGILEGHFGTKPE